MTITDHIDRQHKTIDGVTFKNTHSGQKRAYGDSFYEYDVRSELPADEVECVCCTKVCAAIPETQWRDECKAQRGSMEAHFRNHYKFSKIGDGHYFYSVCFPYTD